MSDAIRRILVVDDEEDIRVVLRGALSAAGYEVTIVAGGAEAMDIVKREKVDLVILDVNMPMIDGFEVLRFIKGRFPAIKVIMLTAYATLKHATEAKKYGAEDFLSKPCDVEDLMVAVQNVLRQ